jgi:histidine triad (HIT) family protein
MGTSACVFCSIVAGDVPAHIVFDEPDAVGFLDAVPLFPGHVLVVPRHHHVTLLDIPVDGLGPFFAAVQRANAAVQAATGSQGIFNGVNNVVSQSVPHLHVHVVPRTKGDGLRGFFWPRQAYESDEATAEVAARIRTALAVL